ncbi:serine/threonine protein kinase [Paraburkholderia haematera]|uniref:non-specific serine/threonine protein kinase n=1 Tax=Paraburkholderia haematera TaxID=2793077 RepID=A0ABM8SFS8_9BURK|nr:serine/threonine-protein kinase [Paraburkholderia haematera]CAE6806389.1 Serine/threonine-protein kinase PknD [Paraburkholderia haematera]
MMDPLFKERMTAAPDEGHAGGSRPLPIGHRLGEFELDSVLGIGGFGIVYRAFDRTLQRTVAVKEYMPSLLARRGGDFTVCLRADRFAQAFDSGRAAFLNEARLLAQFDHPDLVKVLQFWQNHGTAYMVMPFYEGQTLKQRAATHAPMGEAELMSLLAALLGALGTLHRAQCFHRDISLDNVLIRADGKPVLLDFGAARKSIGDAVDETSVMLKPGYAPIEQYTDDPAFVQGPWTDIYSLGALVHAMIVGEPPAAAVVRSIQDTWQPLASREFPGRERYSRPFLEAIDCALQLRIADRPDSVAAFAQLLGLRDAGAGMYIAGDRSQGMREPAALSAGAQGIATAGIAAAAAQPNEPQAGANDLPGVPRPSSAGEMSRPSDADAGGKDQSGAVIQGATGLLNDASGSAAEASLIAETPEVTQSEPAANGQHDDLRLGAQRPGGHRPYRIAGALVLIVAACVGTFKLLQFAIRVPEQHAAAATTPEVQAPVVVVPREPAPPLAQAVPVQPPQAAHASGASESAPHEPVEQANAAAAPATAASAPDSIAADAQAASASITADAQAASAAGASGQSATQRVAAGDDRKTAKLVAVRFQVYPWGEVYVGGVKRGVSPPLKTLTLAPGTYDIEIRNGELPPMRRTVQLDAGGGPVSISYTFE